MNKKEKINKDAFLIVRVTIREKQRLTQRAFDDGFNKLSQYLRKIIADYTKE